MANGATKWGVVSDFQNKYIYNPLCWSQIYIPSYIVTTNGALTLVGYSRV